MTLFEKIKQTKRTDYQGAYYQALENSIATKTHADSITVYSVTGEFIRFEMEKLS